MELEGRKDWWAGATVISWRLRSGGRLYPLCLVYSLLCLLTAPPPFACLDDSQALIICLSVFPETHSQRGVFLLRLSFPHSRALGFSLHPISLPVGLPLLLHPSICPSHTGFTSQLSTMACFKWSNGWIRKQHRDKGCKERSNESRRTPAACYLITAVLACHAPMTIPPEEHRQPPIKPPLFRKHSRISAWAQRWVILSSFWAVHTRFVYPGSTGAHNGTSSTGTATYTAAC